MTDDRPKSSDQAATPEGHTAEAPAVTELGQPGTPGAGMSADVPHAADADMVEHGERPADAHHDPDTHMDVHTALSDDDHGHAVALLGPIDWGRWAYALVGGLAGAVVVFAFWLALN
jgi:hypothetical protein